MQENISSTENIPKTKNRPKIKFGFTWFIIIPGSLWAIVTYYLPLFGGTLNRIETWITTPVIILLVATSLVCHILAHLWVAKLTGAETPSGITILIFGDATQCWPGSTSKWQEIIICQCRPNGQPFDR